MRSFIYLAMFAVLAVVSGCAQMPNPPAQPARIKYLATQGLGFEVVHLVEVDGQKFVIAKSSEGIAIQPLGADAKPSKPTGAIGAEAAAAVE